MVLVALATRRRAGIEVHECRQREGRRHGIHQPDVDLLAEAGRVPIPQREENAVHGVETGQVVRDGDADAGRRTVGEAGHIHQPAFGLDDRVVAGQVLLGARLPVARDRAIDDARVERGNRVVVEAESGEASRSEVLDHDVGCADEATESAGAHIALQVERDALLVSVQAEKKRAPARAVGRPRARIVPMGRLFDLDDLRAHVAEHHRAIGAGEHAREVDDAESIEGGHARGL